MNMNNEKPWTSNAQWPIPKTMENPPVLLFSTEHHETKEQADAVCSLLKSDGLEGEKKVFPLCTWVSKVKEEEQL